MRGIEDMIDEHRELQSLQDPRPSRLKMLVPTVGPFFTALPLEAAFMYQDSRRHISSRRLVAPSFNDVRLTLNTAQLMALTGKGGKKDAASSSRTKSDPIQLVTFDGDLTLYEDGQNLEPDSPLIPRILSRHHCPRPDYSSTNGRLTAQLFLAATSRSALSQRRATTPPRNTTRDCTACCGPSTNPRT